MGEKRPKGRTGLNSEYSLSEWEPAAKEQGGGSVDGKSLRGNIRANGNPG